MTSLPCGGRSRVCGKGRLCVAPRKPAVATGYALIITRIILNRVIALTACG